MLHYAIQLAIEFPGFSPELFSINIGGRHFALRWYAIAYMVGLLAGWRAIIWVIERKGYRFGEINRAVIDDFFVYALIGIIAGGRLFYTLVYQPGYYLSNPLEIIMPPYAGLSFHGGFLGFVIALIYTARKHGVPLLALGDLMALVAPIPIFLVRLANFVNAELWGKETDVAWGMKFPSMCMDPVRQGCEVAGEWFYRGDELIRHPSQLYEAGLEGLLMGTLLWFLYRGGALNRPGLLVAVFFIGNALARILVEIFRNADAQYITPDNPLGHVIRLGEFGLSMGQVLSLPMIVIGLGFLWHAYRRG